MAIWPFIVSKLSREDLGEIVVNHEKIHFRQQIEMLFIFFYLWYFVEYLIRLLGGKNKEMAYRDISFEKEAYQFQANEDYLKKRKLYSWVKFVKNAG